MLLFTYMRRELRHRLRQTIFVVVGLAVGIGLVLTVAATSTGVRDAQSKVLASLYGLGTDVTVTKTATTTQPQAGAAGGSTGGSAGAGGVVRGQPIDVLTPQGETSFDPSATSQVAKLNGVTAASAELELTDLKMAAVKTGSNVTPKIGRAHV